MSVSNRQPESCGLTTDEHFARILLALRTAGVGVSCPQVYEALVELTEAVRVAGNHIRVEPLADGPGAAFAAAMLEASTTGTEGPDALAFHERMTNAVISSVEKAAAHAREARGSDDGTGTTPSEPEAPRGYAALTAEQRRRFN